MSPDTPIDGTEIRFRHLRSIRGRVTLVTAAVVTVVLVTLAALLVQMQTSTAHARLDEILSDEAEAIGLALSIGDDVPILFDDDRVMLARGPDGAILAFTGPSAHGLSDVVVSAPDDRGVTADIDGESHRVVSERFIVDNAIGHVLLAEPLDEFDESITNLIGAVRWAIPIAIAALIIATWLLVGYALRPVGHMRRELAAIGIRQLNRRVDEPGTGDEITGLAGDLNAMLSRLETAIHRQQRFVADASHELRTPLARMRSELEADRADPAGADPVAARESQLEEVAALQRLVDDMLLLARADVGAAELPHDLVDLDDLVLEEVKVVRATTTRPIETSDVSAAQVAGSAADLRRVIRNLLENAARYAETRVVVSLREDDVLAVLTVDDDGPGIPDERRAEVFERFRRNGPARSDHHGAGLGLAIVDEIVRRHGGRVAIEDSFLGGARFVVALPSHH